MKPYTKLYLNYFGFDTSDFIPCEICGMRAVDIHHIHARGMGGTAKHDTIENLMALCRSCHTIYGDIKELKDHLITIHQLTINNHDQIRISTSNKL